jgi:hypothetical protein
VALLERDLAWLDRVAREGASGALAAQVRAEWRGRLADLERRELDASERRLLAAARTLLLEEAAPIRRAAR